MKRLKKLIGIVLLLIAILFVWGKIYFYNQPPLVTLPNIADTLRIKEDLRFLTKECIYRNPQHISALNNAADYISQSFKSHVDSTWVQEYAVDTFIFKNIICSLGPANAERIIIGAHYDVYGEQEGADDNASGVAGLLELARLLKGKYLKYRIDLVAYSTEEPPYFRTQNMGSYVHAKYLTDNKIAVKGMISLEMIGYFSEEANSQSYPLFPLRWFFGNKGNYITIVQKFGNGSFGSAISDSLQALQVLPTKPFKGPKWLPGVDFSDHLNYWRFGYSALMITNTAFYRNHNYHTSDDTFETINVEKLAMVIDELYRVITKLN